MFGPDTARPHLLLSLWVQTQQYRICALTLGSRQSKTTSAAFTGGQTQQDHICCFPFGVQTKQHHACCFHCGPDTTRPHLLLSLWVQKQQYRICCSHFGVQTEQNHVCCFHWGPDTAQGRLLRSLCCEFLQIRLFPRIQRSPVPLSQETIIWSPRPRWFYTRYGRFDTIPGPSGSCLPKKTAVTGPSKSARVPADPIFPKEY